MYVIGELKKMCSFPLHFYLVKILPLTLIFEYKQRRDWRRKWQPTPVFLPRESQGWGSLVGCRLQGCTESDPTEAT